MRLRDPSDITLSDPLETRRAPTLETDILTQVEEIPDDLLVERHFDRIISREVKQR